MGEFPYKPRNEGEKPSKSRRNNKMLEFDKKFKTFAWQKNKAVER